MKPKITDRTALLLLVFIVLGVYYPAIFAPMNSVDDPGMYAYLLNMDSFNFREIFVPGGSGSYYRPLLIVSYLIDKYVWGLEISFMHLENILFHLFNTLLVFAIARKVIVMQSSESGMVPFTSALLFAVHPINTEAVDWIAGRTDLLAAFFLFLSVLFLLHRERSISSPLLAAFCMFVACLAKETAIFFLPAALLFPFFVRQHCANDLTYKEIFLNNWQHFLYFQISCVGYFILRSQAFSRGDNGIRQVYAHVAGEKSAETIHQLNSVFKSAGFYLKKLFVPFPLNFGIIHVSDLYIILGILLVIVSFWLFTRRTLPAFIFLCAASIGSSALIIPLIHQTWTPLAERYMYIPSAFFIIGCIQIIPKRRNDPYYHKVVITAGCIVIIIAIYGTVSRTLIWQDNLTLYQDTLNKSPGFEPAQNEIANELFARGRIDEASEIIFSLKLPANLNNRQYGLVSKAVASVNRGDFVGARNYLDEALKDPGKHEVEIIKRLLKLYDLELLTKNSEREKMYPEMLRLLSRLYSITSDSFYQYRLGQIYMQIKDIKRAQEAFSIAAIKAPENAYYRVPSQKLAAKLLAEIDKDEVNLKRPFIIQ